MSDRRQVENRTRHQVVAALVDKDPWCQARIPGVCTGLAVDAHEIHTRARGGSIVDPQNLVLLCRQCHTHITENPAWADANGWTVHSWDSERVVPP